MELRQLRYILTIVEYGNITRAAEALHVAQPALSQQLRNLEEELGVKLFHRSATGVRPTEAALILRTKAQQILRQVDEARNMIRNGCDMPTGEVPIALPSSTARILAIPLLRRIRASYPGITPNFIEGPSGDLHKLLETGGAELAICVDVDPQKGLNAVPLTTESLFVIQLPEDAAKSKARSIALSGLSRIPLILPAAPNSIRLTLDLAFKRTFLSYDLVAEINSTTVMLQAVRAGMGATVLPWSAVNEEVTAGLLSATPLAAPSMARQLFLCTQPGANLTTASRAVHSLIPAVVQQMVDSGEWRGTCTIS